MTAPTKKVLLMGRAGAGKTSMRSIIFANYYPADTQRLTATNNIEHSHLRFLGNLMVHLWDCGGQDTFMQNYFESQKERIFDNAEVLIYVLEARREVLSDMQHSPEYQKDLEYFKSACSSLRQVARKAKLFYLIHKMDIIEKKEDRDKLIHFYLKDLQAVTEQLDASCFTTTIWDETLFEAWSTIAHSLVPNIDQIKRQLDAFCDLVEADECVLFEKSTFLQIAKSTRIDQADNNRIEKISNICKQFKLTCARAESSSFESLTVQNASRTTYIEQFTPNTYIMLISSQKDIRPGATLCNIDIAKEYFQQTLKPQLN
eukprot:Selendium_serpulae@DN5977_c0_g1_i2.p1